MITITQVQLRNKDTEAMVLLRNEIKASFNTNAIDYFTISAVAEILYNKFKHKKHDMTTVIKDIIAVRHAGINFILNICDKLEKENDCMLTSLRGG